MLMRALTILLTNAAYLFVLSTLNSELAPSAYLVLPALFIIPAALYLDFLPMLAVVGVSAFLCSSTTGVRAGLTAALWLSAAFAVHGMRFRFRSGDWFSITALVEITNIILVFFYALFFPRDVGDFSNTRRGCRRTRCFRRRFCCLRANSARFCPCRLRTFWESKCR